MNVASISFQGLSDLEILKVAKKILDTGSEISIKPSKNESVDTPYYKMGNGRQTSKGTSMDLVHEMSKMSKPELWLFDLIISKFDNKYEDYYHDDFINQVNLSSKHMTGTEKKYLTSGYKLLNSKDIIRKVRRGRYMVNPRIIIPFKDADKAREKWSSLWYMN